MKALLLISDTTLKCFETYRDDTCLPTCPVERVMEQILEDWAITRIKQKAADELYARAMKRVDRVFS